MRTRALVIALVAGCAPPAPDGILVIVTDETNDVLDPGVGHATVDVWVGADGALPFVPITNTRPFVELPEIEDRGRDWADVDREYRILLEPADEGQAPGPFYVVAKGRQPGRGFHAALDHVVPYNGGTVVEYADTRFGYGGVCPWGFAEDEGTFVEIVSQDATSPINCDQDGFAYPDDCADWSDFLYPSPPLAPDLGIVLPTELMCCNNDAPMPAQMSFSSSGPGSCSFYVGCPGRPGPVVGVPVEPWSKAGVGMCECATTTPVMDCFEGAYVTNELTGNPTPQSGCDLALEDDGDVCDGQEVRIGDLFFEWFPPGGECPMRIVWMGGVVGLRFGNEFSMDGVSTRSCDAMLEFDTRGPDTGVPTSTSPAIGWALLDIDGQIVPFHVHARLPAACDGPARCYLH